ncbi:heme peroxidase [Crassisporium funariophilum]|nr:heme peroxidase [Crassisporium funariophilum]
MRTTTRTCSTILLVAAGCIQVSAYQWPSPQYDALEGFLYEGQGFNLLNLASVVTSCRARSNAPNASTIAAEWVRFAYHDMSTHNITDGTGGLDASIFFELDRPENVGTGMKFTATDFDITSTKYISLADTIAIGTVFSIAACGGPIIPFRGGRKDATGPGRPGVPEPQQDLKSHTENFRLQGFTPTEMISLVACGHTFGAVRSTDFPNIVAVNATDPNQALFNTFDSTTTAFDHAIASEYLTGTTKNPLVTVKNVTLASDLRIFNSDGNVTMRSLDSPEAFAKTCSSMFERMLNTVPAGVELTEEITLLPAKVSEAYITVQGSQLVFNTLFRLSRPAGSAAPESKMVRMFWCDRRGAFKDCTGQANVASSPFRDIHPRSLMTEAQGLTFASYQFSVALVANQSVSKFWFEVDEQNSTSPVVYKNGGDGYVIQQDEVIYAPQLSNSSTLFNKNGPGLHSIVTIVAGIRSINKPSQFTLTAFDRTLFARSLQDPFNITRNLTLNSSYPAVGGYSFYSATLETNGTALSVDLSAVIDGVTYTEDYMQALFVGDQFSVAPLSSLTTITVPDPSTSTTLTSPPTPKDTSAARSLRRPLFIMSLCVCTIAGLGI